MRRFASLPALLKKLLRAAGLLGLLTACQPTRTVLLRNYTARPVTLVFPSPAAPFTPTMPTSLAFTATGAAQDTVLDYGPGSWSKTDAATLRLLLAHSRLLLGSDTLELAPHARLITRYRLFVKGLYVIINGQRLVPEQVKTPR